MSKNTGFETLTQAKSTPAPVVLAPVVLDVSLAANGAITLPIGNDILDAEFSRSGRDLMVQAPHHPNTVIINYFSHDTAPALLSETGKQIRGETVALLSGNPAASQYAGPVEGATPIGSVERLDGDVFVKRADGSEIKLSEGDPVYQNDLITTRADGNIGISFVDGSVFTLGSDARMTLDSMVYDPASGEGSSEVTVIKGMFKFISGDIAANNPGDMVVETPVATIGIRGTTGGGNVNGEGQSNQFFLEPNADGTIGSFDVTTQAGMVTMNQPYQQVGLTNINQTPPTPTFTSAEALNQQFGTMNQFVPDGRYENRPDSETQSETAPQNGDAAAQEGAPESSELLAGEGEQPSATEGEQPAAEGEVSGETLKEVEGTGEELSMTGDAGFDGATNNGEPPAGDAPQVMMERAPDPLANPLQQFVNNGSLDQMLSAPQPQNTPQGAAPLNATGGGTAGPIGSVTGAALTPPPILGPTTLGAPSSGSTTGSSTNSFFQTIQEQIRLGNLPPDTLTNPNSGPVIFNPPPPPPPAPGTDNGGTDGGGTGGGGTDTVTGGGSTGGGGGGSTGGGGGTLTLTPQSAMLETLTGDASANVFTVNDWDFYRNASMNSPADVILGLGGVDTIQFNAINSGYFYSYDFSSSTSGIEILKFAQSTDLSSLQISDAMLAQRSAGHAFIVDVDGNDYVDIDLTGVAASAAPTPLLEIHNTSTTSSSIMLTGTDEGDTTQKILLEGKFSVTAFDDTQTHDLILRGGEIMVELSAATATQSFTLTNGTHSVWGGEAADKIVVEGGSEHEIDLGDGDNDITVHNGTGITIDTGFGSNFVSLLGGTGHSVTGGDGDNLFMLMSDSAIVRNWDITSSLGNDTYLISGMEVAGNFVGGVNGVTITDIDGENLFILENGTHTASITGGSGTDWFEISGGGNVTLDGGDSMGGLPNEFWFHNFHGTAHVSARTGVSVEPNDVIEIGNLDSSAVVNVTIADVADANVLLDVSRSFDGATGGGQMFSNTANAGIGATTNDLQIAMQSGGKTVLKDFFAAGTAKNNYMLVTHSNNDPFALLHNSVPGEVRDLTSVYSDLPNIFSAVAGNLTSINTSTVVRLTLGSLNDVVGLKAGDLFTFNEAITFNNITIESGHGYKITQVGSGWIEIDTNYDSAVTSASTSGGYGDTFDGTIDIQLYGNIDRFFDGTVGGGMNETTIIATSGDNVVTAFADGIATVILGLDGDDTLIGGGDGDVLKGGEGNDTLKRVNTSGDMEFYGGDGSIDNGFDVVDYTDIMNMSVDLGAGTAENDLVNFTDTLEGIEAVYGGIGNDTFQGGDQINHFRGGDGDDSLTGGIGTNAVNIADYSTSTDGITIILDEFDDFIMTHLSQSGDMGMDTLDNIQHIIGSAYDDSIGTSSDNTSDHIFYGLEGNDTLAGGAGNDTLFGGAGNDQLHLNHSSVGGDNASDIVVFETGGGVDDIYGFYSDPTASANDTDRLDISRLVRAANLQDYDYFDLVREGFLSITDTGADLTISFDLDGHDAGSATPIANLINVLEVNDLNWRNFITEGGNQESYEYVTGADISGYELNDTFEIDAAVTALSGNLEGGDDTLIINDSIEIGGYAVDAGLGIDRLVLNSAADFAGFVDLGDIQLTNFEIIDLYGNDLLSLSANNVIDLSGGMGELFIQNSNPAGTTSSVTLGSGTGQWIEVMNPENYNLTLPRAVDFDSDDYTTYKVNGTEDIFVHVQNGVDVTY